MKGSPSYYCTWAAQNYLYGTGTDHLDATELEGDVGAAHARAYMNLGQLFGPEGWSRRFHPAARRDLYFLLDDGWDVPMAVDRAWFGSLIPDEERFPLGEAEPWRRYERLNALAREAGWRGLGLWIAAQEAPALWDGQDHDSADQEAYWRERLIWSQRAGIEYWKIDWGRHAVDPVFRENVTAWGRVYAPDLVIEHARCQGPVNDDPTDPERLFRGGGLEILNGRKDSGILAEEVKLLKSADVLRSYDVLAHLSVVQTVERVSALLQAMQGQRVTGACLINCEDELLVAAALGLSGGVMRFPLVGLRPDGDPDCAFPASARALKRRMDEVTRLTAWQRVMPAFSAAAEPVYLSAERLEDRWRFSKGQTWLSGAIGRVVRQSAPAVVSRGLPLPRVEKTGEGQPFVLASRHGDAAAVAALGRTDVDRDWYEPRASVTIEPGAGVRSVGVFGPFASLMVKAPDLQGRSAAVRDLCGDVWHPVEVRGDEVTLPGELIDRVGTEKGTPGDQSSPGLELRLK